VSDLVTNGVLSSGDYLVCDNAKIHAAEIIIDELEGLLKSNGIQIIYLPTYSPELNPAELVFAKSKHYLRYHRGSDSFDDELLTALASVTSADMIKFYEQCLVNYSKYL
jgi:transposase